MQASAPGDPKLTKLVLGRRLEGFAVGSSLAILPAVASLAVLLAVYGGSPGGGVLFVWAAAVGLITLGWTILARSILPLRSNGEQLRRQWRAVEVVLVLGSLAWAAGLPLAAWVAAGSQPPLALAVIGVALMCEVLLMRRSAPAAAIVHILSLGAGLAAGLLIAGGWEARPVLALIGLYAIALIGAILSQDRLLRAACQLDMERRESEQRLRMLLDAHEAQTGHPRPDGGMTEMGPDVIDQQEIEERVRAMAYVDPLTGLANRHLFNRRLRELLGVDRADAKPVALLYLDLDDFKAVNDLHGLNFGDSLLREMGARLRRESGDTDLVARLGGDEFAILIEAPAGDGMLIERGHRLLAAAREPFQIEGQIARVSTSIGIARPGASRDAAEIMRRVDLALYAAKAKGRDQMALFDETLDRRARERRALELELREAVGRGEMVLHYQPIIALQSGATVGYEALLRWRHPQRGLLLPDQFIPIAEESGVIVGLGDWAIRKALADVAEWHGDFRIALNLSPSQIRSPHLIATIDAALAASGIAPSRLELEITEGVLFEDAVTGAAIIKRLRALGAEIALDDFGTGYSSLSYLRRFRFDRVKIDRSFVRDIETSDEAQAIVSAITRLAEALGMQTTAEGVERPEQLDLLRKLGCDEAQGFLILEPVEAERIEESRFRGEDLPEVTEEIEGYREARRAALARPGASSR